MKRNWSKVIILMLFSILISGCNNPENSSSSNINSEQTTLYKAAIGRLYHTNINDFATNLDVCDLSLVNDIGNNQLELTLNNCSEKLSMVDFIMVNKDELTEETSTIYPHYGLEFSDEMINVVPDFEEGIHELVLTMEIKEIIPSTIIVLLSYFQTSEGFEKRIEHYLKFEGNTITIKGD